MPEILDSIERFWKVCLGVSCRSWPRSRKSIMWGLTLREGACWQIGRHQNSKHETDLHFPSKPSIRSQKPISNSRREYWGLWI